VDEGNHNYSIIASANSPAQASCLTSGIYPQFLIYYLGERPKQVGWKSDRAILRIPDPPETPKMLYALDKNLLGLTRKIDHVRLLSDCLGYLYYREGQAVGYGYLGISNGPFAFLDQAGILAILARAEVKLWITGSMSSVWKFL
jgi:hypothetical protein